MFTRRSIRLPITLAVVMIGLLAVLIVGWVLLAVFGALADSRSSGIYWALLSVGTTFMVLLVAGVVTYLALSVKAINLNRRQSNFVDSVTHELKSPIASMKLYLQTLNCRHVSQQEQAEFYRFMLDDVERLDHLINHVLDAGRLDNPSDDDQAEDVDVASLLRECAKTVCLRYRIAVETVSLDLEPCVVSAQSVDLDMIFRNLIDNAVKYAGSDPRVEVTLRMPHQGLPAEKLAASHRIVVRIADNGRGIPPAWRRKIFGRFVRLGLELERKKPGTGLGLYIVRTLVRRLGGRIRVQDRPQGPGTVFEVRLPGSLVSHVPEADGTRGG
ncbi:MAG: HAMP domain-containing histidine kinase [Planctomycetes bacterium]|nr:HAMP domain-containing histidine kinase [Planctomycetota bacterium]